MAKRTEIDLITDSGRLMFGDEWQSRLAAALGIGKSTMSMLLSGQRRVQHHHMVTLAATLSAFKKGLRATGAAADSLRREIEARSK